MNGKTYLVPNEVPCDPGNAGFCYWSLNISSLPEGCSLTSTILVLVEPDLAFGSGYLVYVQISWSGNNIQFQKHYASKPNCQTFADDLPVTFVYGTLCTTGTTCHVKFH
jgi:hypothetical protein